MSPSIMQCSNAFDFKPRLKWPDILPAYCWRGILLCGFGRLSGPVFDLSEQNLVDAIFALYPSLTFGELARLADVFTSSFAHESLDVLLARYGLRPSERLSQTFTVWRQTPIPFQEWTIDKKFGARDLAPLLAADPGDRGFDFFLICLATTTLSKSDGARALELALELYLLGETFKPEPSKRGETLLARLETLRRPRSAQLDADRRQMVAAWPWPKHVQGQWQRFGDEAGIEIRLRAHSPSDLKQKLERLGGIGQTWSKQI